MSGPSVADLFGLTSVKTVEWEGKTYTVPQPDTIARHLFREWLAGQALAAIERQTHLPPAVLAEHRTRWQTDYAAGVYSWFGPVSVRAVVSPEGAARMVSILLTRAGHPEMTPDVCDRVMAAQIERSAAASAEAAARVAAEGGDPNAAAVAAAALETIRTLFPPPPSTPSSGSASTASSSAASPSTPSPG